jgi:hypothetical protein
MRMTHPLTHVCGRAYDPAELKQLMSIFDEVWASLTIDGFGRGGNVAAERNRLATIILDLARDGQFGALEITRTASRLMRQGVMVETDRRRS